MLVNFVIGPPAAGKTTYLQTLLLQENSTKTLIVDDPTDFEKQIKPYLTQYAVIYIADPHLCKYCNLQNAMKLIQAESPSIEFNFYLLNFPFYILERNLLKRNQTNFRFISTQSLRYFYNNFQDLLNTFKNNSTSYIEINTYAV